MYWMNEGFFYLYERVFYLGIYPCFPFSRNIPICSFTAILWPALWEQVCFRRSMFLKNNCQNGSPNFWKAKPKDGVELLALPNKRLSDSMPKILSFLAGLDLDVSDQNLHSYYFLGTYTSFHPYKMDTMSFIMWRLCLNRILNLQFFVAKDYFLELKSVISIININIPLIYCMVFLYLQSNIHKTRTKSLC